MQHTASYDPADNKIRIHPTCRLDEDEYAKVKAAGYKWAPRQELFVAPMWTPQREDLALELCGEIGDEDTSLVDRAEERAERFEGYGENRQRDAESAQAAVSAIADGIPMGQPILVGHHSERHARKDAQRIENGMRRAVRMWECSTYWADRAAGALRHAKYIERPDVRHRRIKKIEAAARKQRRESDQQATLAKGWRLAMAESDPDKALQIAKQVADHCHIHRCFLKVDFPKSEYEGSQSLWGALDKGIIDAKQAAEIALESYARVEEWRDRWAAHYDNRLAYEKAMLGEQGGLAADGFDLQVGGQVLVDGEWITIIRLNKKDGQIVSVSTNARYVKVKPIENIKGYRPPSEEQAKAAAKATKKLPICNYRQEKTQIENRFHVGEFLTFRQVEMTKAQYAKICKDYKGTRPVDGTHRVRIVIRSGEWETVFLTDGKAKLPLAKQAAEPEAAPLPRGRDLATLERRVESSDKVRERDAEEQQGTLWNMRKALREGVQVVSAPQLFPTPPELAERVVELADIQPGHNVLEPSAGTGNLVRAMWDMGANLYAVEISHALCSGLRKMVDRRELVDIWEADFLSLNGELGEFDRIVMNPPFSGGVDVDHIRHALGKLKPDGRLVAICANGPQQRSAFLEAASEWHDLPAGSFRSEGTKVAAAICVFNG